MNVWKDRQSRRYIIALGLIAIAAIGAYIVLRLLLATNESNAALINVSGRQRMLSQRIALFSVAYTTAVDETSRAEARRNLEESVNLFEESHRGLTEGGVVNGFQGTPSITLPSELSPNIRALYFQAPGLVDSQVRNYITAARNLLDAPSAELTLENSDLLFILEQGPGRLLNSLNIIVGAHQLESDAISNVLATAVLAVLILTLAVLAFEAIFIFQPMVVEVRQQQQSLQESNSQLSQQTERLNAQARGLALATDISTAIGRIRDLDELLQTAANLVRERFNLYYVQVYLADAAERTLSLQTGTGSAGQELSQRGHRLPIGPGSLNGLAARDRRAIIIDNTQDSPELFRPNPLLPETRTEMAIPMVVGDRLVGILDLQNDQPYTLRRRDLPAFEVLASQLAIAIENANLFTQVVQTQADFEAQARRLSRRNWQDYLDNVEDRDRLRYTYSMDSPVVGTAVDIDQTIHNPLLTTPIKIVNEQIGILQIETAPNQTWDNNDTEFVNAVAAQVGQQIENLRLIEQAELYRAEAEQALRRLTREGWRDYLYQQEDILSGFHYNGHDTGPLDPAKLDTEKQAKQILSNPIAVRGQPIGQLEVVLDEGQVDPSQRVILKAITERLSNHIENLRLAEQTERALSEAQLRGEELAIINSTVATVTRSRNVAEGLEEILDPLLLILGVRQARIALIDETQTQLKITAERYDFEYARSALGEIIPLKNNILMAEIMTHKRPVKVNDTTTDPRLEGYRELITSQQIQSLAIIPMLIDDEVIGTLGIDCLPGDPPLTDQQIELAETVLLQTGTAIQNLELSERAQRRAEELSMINNLGRVFAQQLNERDLLDEALNQIEHIFKFDSFFIGLVDPKGDKLQLPLTYDLGERHYDLPPLNLTGDSYSSRVFASQTPLLIHLTPAEHEELKQTRRNLLGDNEYPTASLIFVPMLLGGQMIGIMTIQSNEFNAYDQNDVNVLSGIANNFVVSWQNTQLYQQAERRAQRERLVNEIGQKIQGTVSMESAIETTLRELGNALKARASRVKLVEVEAEADPNAEFVQRKHTGSLVGRL